jgi:hypothetical protein
MRFRSRAVGVAAAALSIGAAPISGAQQCPAGGAASATATQLIIFASLPEDNIERADLRRARGSVLQEFVAHFARPKDITIVQAKALDLFRRAGGIYEPGMPPLGEVRFTVSTAGRSNDARMAPSTSDPELDAALLGAVAELDLARVSAFAAGTTDTLQMRIQLSLNPSAGTYPMPFMQLAPLSSIDKSAHIIATNIYPKWPKKMEDARTEDDVVLQILVDAHGRAVMDSVKVVQGKHQEYIDAVKAVIPQYRWTPAMSGGCPVMQWVRMPFMFHFK